VKGANKIFSEGKLVGALFAAPPNEELLVLKSGEYSAKGHIDSKDGGPPKVFSNKVFTKCQFAKGNFE
jgi:hypothetical protein